MCVYISILVSVRLCAFSQPIEWNFQYRVREKIEVLFNTYNTAYRYTRKWNFHCHNHTHPMGWKMFFDYTDLFYIPIGESQLRIKLLKTLVGTSINDLVKKKKQKTFLLCKSACLWLLNDIWKKSCVMSGKLGKTVR